MSWNLINFPLKLFDFFSQSFPCIYFQGGKAHQGKECAAGAAAAPSSKVAISKQHSLVRTDLWSEIVDAEDMTFCSVCPEYILMCATSHLLLWTQHPAGVGAERCVLLVYLESCKGIVRLLHDASWNAVSGGVRRFTSEAHSCSELKHWYGCPLCLEVSVAVRSSTFTVLQQM